MRENGGILVKVNKSHFPKPSAVSRVFIRMGQNYGGSFANFIQGLQREKPKLTALDVVLKVVEVFPSFRDITTYEGREGRSCDPPIAPPPASDIFHMQCTSSNELKSW